MLHNQHICKFGIDLLWSMLDIENLIWLGSVRRLLPFILLDLVGLIWLKIRPVTCLKLNICATFQCSSLLIGLIDWSVHWIYMLAIKTRLLNWVSLDRLKPLWALNEFVLVVFSILKIQLSHLIHHVNLVLQGHPNFLKCKAFLIWV